jgi:hypothetical protein
VMSLWDSGWLGKKEEGKGRVILRFLWSKF